MNRRDALTAICALPAIASGAALAQPAVQSWFRHVHKSVEIESRIGRTRTDGKMAVYELDKSAGELRETGDVIDANYRYWCGMPVEAGLLCLASRFRLQGGDWSEWTISQLEC